MKLDRRTVLSGTAAAFAAPFLTALPARADAKRQSLVDSCLESARKVLGGKDFPDAAKQMPGAQGVLIMPELVQGGFILGAAGGRGALMARNGAREWSPPAFYGMGSGSLGLQIGAKVSEIVFIIRTEKGLNAILDHKFKFGAEAGVTMVAIGIGLEGASTTAGGADIVAFAQFDRPVRRRLARRLLYRRRQRLECALLRRGRHGRAIVLDRRYSNPGAEPIRQYLAQW